MINTGPAICVVVFTLVSPAPAGAGSDGTLVLTDAEFEANLTFRERSVEILAKPGDPLAPRIVVEKPDVGSDVAPPVEVAVRFEPTDGATIDLGTLRIRYGWFDITERVLESMDVTAEGIAGRIQSMRLGSYSLKISIADTEQRESAARIEFHVVDTATAGK